MIQLRRTDIPKHLLKYFRPCQTYKPKDDASVPHRVYHALMADGWYGRQDIVWNRPNPMPESIRDRCTKSHSYVFLLTKRPRYFWDAEAVREPSKPWIMDRTDGQTSARTATSPGDKRESVRENRKYDVIKGANARSVWTIPTHAYKMAHFATWPPALVERMVKAGTSEKGVCPQCLEPWVRVVERAKTGDWSDRSGGRLAMGQNQATEGKREVVRIGGSPYSPGYHQPRTTGWKPGCRCMSDDTTRGPNLDNGDRLPFDPIPATVCDPFAGSCTTLAVACQLGRHAIGIELNPAYVKMGHERIGKTLHPSTHVTDDQIDAPLFGVTHD